MSIKQAIEARALKLADSRLEDERGTYEWSLDAEITLRECVAALAALRSMPAEPLFYYRPCMDGLYEGPHHARSVLGKMLREERPNDWHPLYATPHTAPLSDAEIRTGWMCATTFRHELGEATGGSTVYSDLDDLKAGNPCWQECGVVQVEVRAIERAVLGRGGEQ